MKKIILCGHTGSDNHGCEAILKGTTEIFIKQKIDAVLATKAIDQDIKYGVEEFFDVISYNTLTDNKLALFIGRVINKLTSSYKGTEFFHQRNVWKELKGKVAINVGGDTYCYDIPRSSILLNLHTSKKNISNILWACSIEDNAITDFIKEDLKRYSLIMPRETMTYKNLVDAGIDEKKLKLMVDPAFVLKTQKVKVDENFFKKGVVGINLSPLVIEECPKSEMVLKNYYEMIDYIIKKTKYNICLIPHVYSRDNLQDLVPLKHLYEKYKDTKRLILIEKEINCKQIKYIISKCELFVCARTHASIAAYSSFVPTLVVGYSVKSKGIAKDIFGKMDGYVISTQDLVKQGQLKEGFINLDKNKEKIKKQLEDIMPEYKKIAFKSGEIIKEYCNS